MVPISKPITNLTGIDSSTETPETDAASGYGTLNNYQVHEIPKMLLKRRRAPIM